MDKYPTAPSVEVCEVHLHIITVKTKVSLFYFEGRNYNLIVEYRSWLFGPFLLWLYLSVYHQSQFLSTTLFGWVVVLLKEDLLLQWYF